MTALPPPWYERHAWLIFVAISILALFIGISGDAGPVGSDAPLGAMAAGDESPMGTELQLRGSFAFGMGVFGIFLAAFAYRRFEKWSWYAMLTWPAFFALHIAAFGTWLPDAIFLALCVLALALPARRFLTRAG